jgi:hypothetical protein
MESAYMSAEPSENLELLALRIVSDTLHQSSKEDIDGTHDPDVRPRAPPPELKHILSGFPWNPAACVLLLPT